MSKIYNKESLKSENVDNVIRLIVRMSKSDIAFTEKEAVKFFHKEIK